MCSHQGMIKKEEQVLTTTCWLARRIMGWCRSKPDILFRLTWATMSLSTAVTCVWLAGIDKVWHRQGPLSTRLIPTQGSIHNHCHLPAVSSHLIRFVSLYFPNFFLSVWLIALLTVARPQLRNAAVACLVIRSVAMTRFPSGSLNLLPSPFSTL